MSLYEWSNRIVRKGVFLDDLHHRSKQQGVTETTFLKHVQTLEDEMKDRVCATERERKEPLNLLITPAAAKNCRETTRATEKEIPQDESQARKLVLKAPNSAVGLLISAKASLHEVAIHFAKRTLSDWVRFLKPFASGPGLAILISRLVYEDVRRPRADGTIETIRLAPPEFTALGKALREVTPTVEKAVMYPWLLIADMEAALNLESEFQQNPQHTLRPNSTSDKEMKRSHSYTASRPFTTGAVKCRSPKGCSGGLRRSGAFPWADYQDEDGFRQTQMTNHSPKQMRKYPGPDIYGDVDKIFTAPQRADFGRFPRAGGRRTQCTSTPLSQLGRFFSDDHKIP
jgi:hypothetical protein